MREKFPGFYIPTEEEFKSLWNECLFVFDTNALLYVYRYPDSSRNLLINMSKKLKDRIWIPYQVGMEYHLQVNNEISNQHKAYEDLQKALQEKFGEIEDLLKKQSTRHVNIKINTELLKSMENSLEELIKDLNQQKKTHPNLITTQRELAELFHGKVGQAYSQDRLNEIFKEGAERYPVNIPPGFKDTSEKKNRKKLHEGLLYEDQYGDLVLWFQVIDKANELLKPIILITDDTKEDWWREEKGKTIGPHPQLIKEFKEKTNGLPIYMYQTERFIEYAQKYLNLEEEQSDIDIAVRGIEEVKKAEQQHSENNSSIPGVIEISENGNIAHYVDLRKSYYGAILKSDFSTNEVIKDFRNKLTLIFPQHYIKIRIVDEEQEWIFLRVILGGDLNIDTQYMKERLKELETKLGKLVDYNLSEFEKIDHSSKGILWGSFGLS